MYKNRSRGLWKILHPTLKLHFWVLCDRPLNLYFSILQQTTMGRHFLSVALFTLLVGATPFPQDHDGDASVLSGHDDGAGDDGVGGGSQLRPKGAKRGGKFGKGFGKGGGLGKGGDDGGLGHQHGGLGKGKEGGRGLLGKGEGKGGLGALGAGAGAGAGLGGLLSMSFLSLYFSIVS